MNKKSFLFLFNLIFIFLIEVVQPKSIENSFSNNIVPENGEFFFVFVKNIYGNNININSNEYKNYINSIIENIHEIIINNINTYSNPSEIEKLQNEYEKSKDEYMYDYGKYGGIIYPTYPHKDKIILYAYLNSNIVEQVESIENVLSVNKDIKSITEQDPLVIEVSSNENCNARRLGYPCCSKDNTEIYYHDENGDWGYDFELNQWCGLSLEGEDNNICWSELYGFPCCTECLDNTYVDSYGTWGIENDTWCGIKTSC